MASENINASLLTMVEDRRKKLDERSFDWAAWKKGTLMVLKNAFGEESLYYKQLVSIDYEYSSWSLRDTSGSSDPVKSSCADLLDICILDLKNQLNINPSSDKVKIEEVLKKYLSGAQLKKINKIIESDSSPFEKEENISEIFNQLNPAMINKLIAGLLISVSK